MIKKFLADERGATAVEYGLVAALIAVGLVAGAQKLGIQLSNDFTSHGDTLAKAGVQTKSG